MDCFKKLMEEPLCCQTCVVSGLVALVTVLVFGLFCRKSKTKFVGTPGKVILHQIPRGFFSPNISPFALKLETYLRLAKIPYEVDTTAPHGPKGKLPWITLDGEDMADSTLIIRYLNKRFNVDLNKDLDDAAKGVSWAVQTMLEDHYFWFLALYRTTRIENVLSIFPVPAWVTGPVFYLVKRKISNRAKGHGFGLHSAQEQSELARKDVQSLSHILGTKPFYGGETPSELDCCVFGFTVQMIYNTPGSELQTVINEDEMKNLREHCNRMKELVWSDWNECLYPKP